MKRLFAILFLIFGFSVFVTNVHAQEDPNITAKKYNVSFPIASLGGCKDYSDCRNYCDDQLHSDACIAFAKSKGFYKEDIAVKNTQVLSAAQSELGCTSVESCRDFCSSKANIDKCSQFAKLHGLSGGQTKSLDDQKIIEKAKESLGCTSHETCSAFCSKEENRQRCSEFAKTVGLKGGNEEVGPGGCTSEETCRAFCNIPTNIEICKQFAQVHSNRNFTGPGGCTDEVSCRAYCQNNPQACNIVPFPSGYGNSRESQETACKAGGGTCNWNGDSCNCQGYDASKDTRYRTQTSPTPSYGDASKGDYSCGQAALAVGCYTVDKTCKCPSSYPVATGNSTNWNSRESQETACKAGGGTCNWNGDSCNCQGYHAPSYTPTGGTTATSQPSQTQQPQTDPATQCAQTSGCSWTGSTCQCAPYATPTPAVQGIQTVNDIFEQIKYYLKRIFGQ